MKNKLPTLVLGKNLPRWKSLMEDNGVPSHFIFIPTNVSKFAEIFSQNWVPLGAKFCVCPHKNGLHDSLLFDGP